MEIEQDSIQLSLKIETDIRNLFQCFHSSDDVRSRRFTLLGLKGSILYLTTVIELTDSPDSG